MKKIFPWLILAAVAVWFFLRGKGSGFSGPGASSASGGVGSAGGPGGSGSSSFQLLLGGGVTPQSPFVSAAASAINSGASALGNTAAQGFNKFILNPAYSIADSIFNPSSNSTSQPGSGVAFPDLGQPSGVTVTDLPVQDQSADVPDFGNGGGISGAAGTGLPSDSVDLSGGSGVDPSVSDLFSSGSTDFGGDSSSFDLSNY